MNKEAKKKLLRKIPYGLYVIGLKKGNEINGFTASWVSQVSFVPPMVMIAVQKKSRALKMIKSSKVFSINFLNKNQKDIAKTFFRPSRVEGDTLGGYSYHLGKTGTPVLDNAIGFLDCQVKEILGQGDHAVVIGKVIDSEISKDIDILTIKDTPWNYGG